MSLASVFAVSAAPGVVTLTARALPVSSVEVANLEIEYPAKPAGPAPAAYQNVRGKVRALTVQVAPERLSQRLIDAGQNLSAQGFFAPSLRFDQSYLAARVRVTLGINVCEIGFRLQLIPAGASIRVLADNVAVFGFLPIAGPVIVHQLLHGVFFSATGEGHSPFRPRVRGLCDLEIDVVRDTLWHLLPPAGWRLPAWHQIELSTIRIEREQIVIDYEPIGARGSRDIGARPAALATGASFDLMHSADELLRQNDLDGAMRGYRSLLGSTSNSFDQQQILRRMLAVLSTKTQWFSEATELARQALSRNPQFAPSHLALAAVLSASGDSRAAAREFGRYTELATQVGDADGAALAALAGARLLRQVDPRTATKLFATALEFDPASHEALEGLTERLSDEGRWTEVAALWQARAERTSLPAQAADVRVRLADILLTHLRDVDGAARELGQAQALSPTASGLHELQARILAAQGDIAGAATHWRRVIAVAETQHDKKQHSKALSALAGLVGHDEAEPLVRKAIELDPTSHVAIAKAAELAVARGDLASAASRLESIHGLGLPFAQQAPYDLQLATVLVELKRLQAARATAKRVAIGDSELAAQAAMLLGEIALADGTPDVAANHFQHAGSLFAALADAGAGDSQASLQKLAARAYAKQATTLEQLARTNEAVAAWQLAQKHGQHVAAADVLPTPQAMRDLVAKQPEQDQAATLATLISNAAPDVERILLRQQRLALLAAPATDSAADHEAAVAEANALLADVLALGPVTALPASSKPGILAGLQIASALYQQRGDAAATAVARQAVADLAQTPSTYAAAAIAYLAQGQPDLALAAAKRGLAAPSDPNEITDDTSDRVDADRQTQTTLWETYSESCLRLRDWAGASTAGQWLLSQAEISLAKRLEYSFALATALDRMHQDGDALATIWPLVPKLTDGASDDPASQPPPGVKPGLLRLYAELSERADDGKNAALAWDTLSRDDTLPVEQRAEAAYRAGEHYRRADDEPNAIRALDQTLRLVDSHLPALDALETLCRARGDFERLAAILGRKVAAMAKYPARQKPLLTRLAELQLQLGRPDVADQTYLRALEIDPDWRPALTYVVERELADGDAHALRGLAKLTGDLPSDHQRDPNVVAAEKARARTTLAEYIAKLPLDLAASYADLVPLLAEGWRTTAAPVFAAALATLGEPVTPSPAGATTPATQANPSPDYFRGVAASARAEARFRDAFLALQAALALAPTDHELHREVIEAAQRVGDFDAVASHLEALALTLPAVDQGDCFLELAEVHFEQQGDSKRGRDALAKAAKAFPPGTRRYSALRLLASEASTALAWQIAVDALADIPPSSRTGADVENLAVALLRLGKEAAAVRVLGGVEPEPALGNRGASLLANAIAQRERKREMAKALQAQATEASVADAEAYLREAAALYRDALEDDVALARIDEDLARLTTKPTTPTASHAAADLSDARLQSMLANLPDDASAARAALNRFAQGPDRRAQARAHYHLSRIARKQDNDRDVALRHLRAAYQQDETFVQAWVPLADMLIGNQDLQGARVLYERAANAAELPAPARQWASERVRLLLQIADNPDDARPLLERLADYSTSSAAPRPITVEPTAPMTTDLVPLPAASSDDTPELRLARQLAAQQVWHQAIAMAERAAANQAPAAWPLLVALYMRVDDPQAAGHTLARQIAVTDDLQSRAALWVKRADLFASQAKPQEEYNCLKAAHACVPQDAVIAARARQHAMRYQQWKFAASLLYRQIAATDTPVERAALHEELAYLLGDKLGDATSASRNRDQAAALRKIAASPEAALLEAEAERDHARVRREAESLWRRVPGHQLAFRVLAADARKIGDASRLADLTKQRASHSDDPAEQTMIWLDVAHCAQTQANFTLAGHAYDQALIATPDHAVALDSRADLAYRVGDWATASYIYRDLDPMVTMLPSDELALRRSIIAEQLATSDGNQTSLHEALQFAHAACTAAASRRDLWMRLQELATRCGELDLAMVAAKHVLTLIPAGDTASVFTTKLGIIELQRARGDLPTAIASLERLVRDNPGHVAARELLAQLYREGNDFAALAGTLYQLVPLSGDNRGRAARLFALGEVYEDLLGDSDRADDAFLRAADLAPDHVPTLLRLVHTYWRGRDLAAIRDVVHDIFAQQAQREMSPLCAARAAIAMAVSPHPGPQLSQLVALHATTSADLGHALATLARDNRHSELVAASGGLLGVAAFNTDAAIASANHPAVAKVLAAR